MLQSVGRFSKIRQCKIIQILTKEINHHRKKKRDDLLGKLKMCAGVCALQMVRAFVQPHLSDDLLLRQNNLCRQSEGEYSTYKWVYMFSGFFLLYYINHTRIFCSRKNKSGVVLLFSFPKIIV